MSEGMTMQWFIPGKGIDRQVINSTIQRYLGNDATVRPGLGPPGEHEGVEGYWIKALRNLTSYQVEDLRAASAKWARERQLQRPGSSDTFVGSQTYQHQAGARGPGRGGDSPLAMEPGYGNGMPIRREPPRMDPRMVDSRMPDPRISLVPTRDDDMELDYPPQQARRHDDNRGFGQERQPFHESRMQYQEPAGYRAPPGPYGYGAEPRDTWDQRDVRDTRDMRDARDMPYPRDMRDARLESRGQPQYPMGAPGPNYPRVPDGGYYPPNTGAYGGAPLNAPMQPPYGANGYGPPPPPVQGIRDNGREPRYGAPAYVNDPRGDPRNAEARYAYPSPPVTVVDTRDTPPNIVPPSVYPAVPGQGAMPTRYDYDGRPQQSQGVGFPLGSAPPLPTGPFNLNTVPGPPRGPNQGQRPLVTNDLGPDPRRRRIN